MRLHQSEAILAKPITAAWLDLRQSLANWQVWVFFGWTDIKLRYRRTVLGPFWLTASNAIMIGGMGVVYTLLFRQDPASFLPYLTSGIILWGFIAQTINEGCLSIVEKAEIYRNTVQPYFYAILRVIFRNVIIFAHHIVIFIAVAIFFRVNALENLHLFILGMVGFLVNAVWAVLFLAMICARYRDAAQLVGSIMSILLMVTPVFWPIELLGERTYIALLNPFTHFLQTLRGPLLGAPPPLASYMLVWSVAVIGWVIAFYMFTRKRSSIVYWL